MIDDRLTEHIEAGAKARPMFSTEVVKTDGGWTITNSRWSYPLHEFEFNVTPGVVGETELDNFVDLFYACGGMANTFKFRHWADYEGVNEAIGTGNGSSQTIQLIKNYTRGAVTRTRKITRPVSGSVVIYFNGVEQVAGVTVDYDTGEVTCSPGVGVAVTADFEFDVPVRFADDSVELLAHTRELQQPVRIVLEEDRE